MRVFPGAFFIFVWLLAGCSLLVGNYSAKDDLEDASALEDGSALEVNPDDAGIADESGVMEEDTCAGTTICISQIQPALGNPTIDDTVFTEVKISTDKPALCRYSWKDGTDFDLMKSDDAFIQDDDDLSHRTHIAKIETIKGQHYLLRVKCRTTSAPSITNQGDFKIDFWVNENPKNIYRSVGQPGLLASSSSHGLGLTIHQDGWLTMNNTSGQSLSNIGVGDILRFASSGNGDPDTCLMIVGRLGQKERFAVRDIYNTDLVSSFGDLSGSSWEVCRAYTDFTVALLGTHVTTTTCFGSCNRDSTNWESENRDLTKLGYERIWNFAGYKSTMIQGWMTLETNIKTSDAYYIKIYAPYLKNEVAESQRHIGIFDNTKAMVRKIQDSSAIFTFSDAQHVWIDGLQADVTINEGLGVAQGNSFLTLRHDSTRPQGWIKVSNNLVKGYGRPFNTSCDETSDNLCYRAYCERCDTGSCQQGNCAGHCAIGNHALYMLNATSTNVYLWNNVFFGFRQLCAGSEATAILLGPTETFNNLYLYNNTFVDNQYAIKAYDVQHSLLMVNNLFSCSGNGSVSEFVGSLQMHPKSTYNATSLSYDNSSFEAYSMPGITFCSCPFTFQGLPGATNFHLQSSDTGARNLGTCPLTDEGIPPPWYDDDFEGDPRPACPPNNPLDPTSYWDIGADEYVPPTLTHRQSDQK